MIDRVVNKKLIKTDVKFYLKYFKELILTDVISNDEYKNISELI
jgi:hypothetical protein